MARLLQMKRFCARVFCGHWSLAALVDAVGRLDDRDCRFCRLGFAKLPREFRIARTVTRLNHWLSCFGHMLLPLVQDTQERIRNNYATNRIRNQPTKARSRAE